uniref:Toll-like receptor 13-like n=1 Tax=Saccoglossus kowalevskii TaxID=10224 RepID=A0ABM0M240_SACKO|nr:PREDICTED: toll-like receptor 13-like [Saccoglossus kowalevskii]
MKFFTFSRSCTGSRHCVVSTCKWAFLLAMLSEWAFSVECQILEVSSRPCKVYNLTYLDCRFQNIIDVPSDLAKNLTSLDLLVNNITSIRKDSFLALSQLVYLELSRNNIVEIEPYSFSRLERLEYLGLLRTGFAFKGGFHITTQTFHGLGQLRTLDLTLAGLNDVSKEYFFNTPNLRTLRLSLNFIYVLPEDTFEYVSKLELLDLGDLRELYLNWTRITTMPLDPISPLLNLRMLFIEGPFTIVDFNSTLTNLRSLSEVETNVCNFTDLNNLENAYCYDTNFSHAPFQELHTNSIILNEVVIEDENINKVLAGPFSPSTRELYLELVTGLSIKHINGEILNGVLNSSIEIIDLSRNDIVGIEPGTFHNMTNIKHLNLSSNAFCLLDKPAFEGLENLKILDLTSSHLFSVPYLRPLTHLQVFNMSFNSLKNPINYHAFREAPNLEVLILKHTSLSDLAISNGCLHNLTNLQVLDLSENELIYIPRIINENILTMPNLKKIDFSNNYHAHFMNNYRATLAPLTHLESADFSAVYPELFIFSNVTSLKELTMNNNNGQAGQWGGNFNKDWVKYQIYLPRLEFLSLSNSAIRVLSLDVVSSIPAIKHLDLTHNLLKSFDRSVFSTLSYLVTLDLSSNLIAEAINTWNQTSLHTILLHANKLTVIDEDWISEEYLPSLKTLDVSSNSLKCNCDLVWFRMWIETDANVNLIDYGTYTCTSPTNNSKLIHLKDFNPNRLQCTSPFPLILTIVGSILFAMLFILIVISVYHRWYIRYGCFLLRLKVRGYREITDETEMQKSFDAFVSYNSKDLQWVLHTLVPTLETGDEPTFRLCTDYRHFIAGKSIVDNILDSILDSRKTILVLTPNFVTSEWCHFELEMAQHRLFEDDRDVLIIIVLEDIPDKILPRRLRKLFCKKTFIKWPQEEEGREFILGQVKGCTAKAEFGGSFSRYVSDYRM